MIETINQILFLISGRWVGIEGVMAVAKNEDLGYQYFLNSFNEKFNYSNSFYENKIKKIIIFMKIQNQRYIQFMCPA